jgi:dTMP kinase
MGVERGKWIDFEGIGRSGKSTQIKAAQNFLSTKNIETVLTREPGGTADLEALRNFIFESRGLGLIDKNQQVALFMASRYVSIPQIIVKPLEGGKYPLSDRSFPSTNAYQGYGEGADQQKILMLSDFLISKYQVRPNGIIFIDISIDEFIKRKELSGSDGDPFDEQQIEYTQRVITGYREMADQNWAGLDWYVINGEAPIDIVSQDLKAVLWEIVNKD